MRRVEKRNREGDRVTRRSGTKLFSQSGVRSAERADMFDDREEIDVRRRPRDGSEYAAGRRGSDDGYRYERRRAYDDDDRYERRRVYGDDDYSDSRRRYTEDDRYERPRRYEDEPRYERRPRYAEDDTDRRRRYGDDREEARPPQRAPRSQSAPRRQAVRTPAQTPATEPFLHQIVPYLMFWVALFAAVSFILRDVAGLSEGAGVIGNWFADFLNGLLGVAAYFLPLMMMVLAIKWKRFLREDKLAKKILLSSIFLLLLSAIIHVFQDRADLVNAVIGSDTLFHNGVMRKGGGLFGGFFGEWMGKGLRLPGTCLLAIPFLIIIGIYLVGLTPSGLWQRLNAKISMMRRQGREERGAHGVERTDKDTQERSAGRDGGWREPQALGAGAYDFHEDEPDVAVTPLRRKDADAGETDTSDFSHRATSAFGAYRPDAVRDILDIPDDEPEIAPPSEGARSILEGAGHSTDSAGQTLADILRDLAEPAPAPEAPASGDAPLATEVTEAPATDKKSPSQGDYYAPFALPIRPEPRRERKTAPMASATAEPVTSTSPVGERVAPSAPAVMVDDTPEESLGHVRTTPYTASPAATSVYRAPVYQNPAEAYRADPAVMGFEPIPEELTPVSVTPVPTNEPAFAVAEREESIVAEVVTPVETVVTHVTVDDAATPESLFDFDTTDDMDTTVTEGDSASDVPEIATEAIPRRETVFDRNPFATDEDGDGEDEMDEPPTLPVTPATPAVTRESVTDTRPAYVPPVQATPAPTPPTPVVRVEPVKTEPAPVPVPRRPYTRPHVGLLAEDENVRTSDFYEEIEDTKQILRDTLESFNIHIQDQIAYSHGPSVTRYELRPVAGTSVRSVTNRIDDIALNLAASVRIEAPIPGKPAIGIEVPNKVRETVYMRTMLESEEFRRSFKPLEVPLGLDVGGAVRMCNLAAMPHLLIAGTTGSGKSVCINSILVSLIFKTSPDDLRLILIDPKQIEFAPYEHVPHLYMPIVTDMQRAAGALACAVQEMERRFSLIRDVGVRNIEAYNEATKNDPDREHLPYIVIVIDEFADLKMSVANNDPENFTCRIAQKARAAGIHLIIGTQRPSVDVITGKLKTNIPSRIAFMVKQQVDSRTILDVNGAEALTGRGDMLYMASNSQDKAPVRVQGAYVSDKELEDVISYVRSHNDPVQYNQAFMEQIEIEMARAQSGGKKGDAEDFGDVESDGGEDPKFIEAVKLAVETQKVATSLLQRRIGVGYGRAAKIIDRMEELGLVSAAEGNRPRQILPAAQGYLNHIAAGGDMPIEDDGADGFDDYIV